MLPASQYLAQGKCKDCKEFGLYTKICSSTRMLRTVI